jgi:hypothetical protein
LLSPEVYREIFRSLEAVHGLDCVEIGGAAGAGSIAAAWGLSNGENDAHLIVVEKCEGGSRAAFGGRNENLERIESNFRTFGVHNKIKLFPHELTWDNREEVLALVDTPKIGALILDADGRIDRDFRIFWPRLEVHAPIIIDDYKNEPEFCPRSKIMPDGGIKKVLTYRLVNQFSRWGLFKLDRAMGSTLFGHKPAGASFSDFDTTITDQILHELQQERLAFLNARGLPEMAGD